MSVKWPPALLLAVLLMGCATTPVDVGPPLGYNATVLVFVSRAEEPSGEIYLVNENGSIRRLTFNKRMEDAVALSPDRTRIAYHAGKANDPLTWEIYVMDLRTGRETRITDNNFIDGHPDWSPDGKKLVFASFQFRGRPSGGGNLAIYDLESGRTRWLTSNRWENNDPEWSPDGRRIVFKSTRDTEEGGREQIYVINIDGSGLERLTRTEGWVSDHDPSWAPDSGGVVFERYEAGRFRWNLISNSTFFVENFEGFMPWNIYSADLSGNTRRLTNTSAIAYLPVYSPDGSRIMYIELEPILRNGTLLGFYKRLAVISPDGSNKTYPFPDSWYGKHIYGLRYFDW